MLSRYSGSNCVTPDGGPQMATEAPETSAFYRGHGDIASHALNAFQREDGGTRAQKLEWGKLWGTQLVTERTDRDRASSSLSFSLVLSLSLALSRSLSLSLAA